MIQNNTPANRSASISLANPSCADQFYLGGEVLPLSGALGLSSAPFTIVNNDHNSGVFGFSTTNYTVNENAGTALITLIRTNGTSGNVTVKYATTLSGTGVIGHDYWPTNGTLYFADGVTSLAFAVPIINNTNIQPQDLTVSLNLTYLSSGSYGLTNSTLTIINDNYPVGFVNFSQPSYATNESAGTAVLTLTRTGGSRGVISVQVPPPTPAPPRQASITSPSPPICSGTAATPPRATWLSLCSITAWLDPRRPSG